MNVTVRGIAFSGYGGVVKVDISDDGGKNWSGAKLGENFGPYSFRTWETQWAPKTAGRNSLMVRATDEKETRSPMRRSGTPAATCGTGLSGWKLWLAVRSNRGAL